MLCSHCCHVAAAVLPACLPAVLSQLPALAAVVASDPRRRLPPFQPTTPRTLLLPCLPACRYTTLLICAPFWYMMRVLVMRHQQKARGGFAAEDEYQRPKGKAAAEPAESDSPLGGKSPTTSSVFKIDSEQGSGELPPAAP